VIYSHHVRVADRWRVGRIFLAGDAAHAMPPWIGQGMSAGVRDAANLCWKLAAVLKGQAPEPLLDTYQAERKPHVTEVTRRACRTGRIITERNRAIAVVRNHLLRTILRVPAVSAGLDQFTWIPDARYREGFLSSARNRAVGWQIPQPWVTNADGARVRFDELLGGRWVIIHVGSAPRGSQAWADLGVPTIPIVEPTLARWLRRRRAAAAVLRPDGFIYAAAGSDQTLTPPPTGYVFSTATRTEASA
jgi:3-(3-hydroxy-phenyl)propionate hydroxylase